MSGDRFVGREREIALLEEAWASPAAAFIPLYGRRRVGKSELILHFMRKRPGIYHVGKVAPAALQLREFLAEAARELKQPLLAALPADSWRTALDQLEPHWKRPGKLVLAFDEFQWTAGASPELPSLLQELWDRRWKRSGKVLLILCGSFIGFMEREILGRQSPLFGRRTAQIHLQPLSYSEAARFHRSWSLPQRAGAYFIVGGVPQYLLAFAPEKSLTANIEANLLTEFAPLFREPEFLLREELRDVTGYHAVLLAIAQNLGSGREIARVSGLPERSLHYYLEQLVQLGYVARRFPLTGEREAKRHVRFSLEDPLLRFWFRFVFPNQSFVQQHGPRHAFQELLRPNLESYFGSCFERLCREALPKLLAQEGVEASVRVGEYWDKEVQIDVVGMRDDGWTELGECKWGSVRSPSGLTTELERKVLAYPNPRNHTLGRRFFLRQLPRGVRRPRWHSLEDLYAAAGARRG
ncbi:MAG: ATP-binding protein [Myxococcales bacterium]|nr:ATP-binding protein [Myxococcales bacterium]